MHNSLYQNGFFQDVLGVGGSVGVDDIVDGDNQTMDIFRKSTESNKNTNTSSSQSSSSNQSERQNMLPHYQPRWHQQLNQSMLLRNPLHASYIKAHLDSVNHEIAQLDSRIEHVLLKQHSQCAADKQSTIYRHPIDAMVGNSDNAKSSATITTTSTTTTTTSSVITSSPTATLETRFNNVRITGSAGGNVSNKNPQQRPLPNNPPPMDSDTEHIYETIPEDSESEPIYCSPYKAEDDDTGIVEEWLNMQGNQKRSKTPWSRTTKSNSSMEDHENSSSAYNTGGSCNSNHHLTLELNVNDNSCNDKDGSKTLVFCPTKHLQPQFPGQQEQNVSSKPPLTRTTSNKKDKTISPTHEKRRSQSQSHQQQEHQATSKKSSAQNQGQSNLH